MTSATSPEPGSNPIIDGATPLAPGDEARPGTPGSGEDLCRRCGGSGQLDGQPCPECGGTGKVTVGVGGG